MNIFLDYFHFSIDNIYGIKTYLFCGIFMELRFYYYLGIRVTYNTHMFFNRAHDTNNYLSKNMIVKIVYIQVFGVYESISFCTLFYSYYVF